MGKRCNMDVLDVRIKCLTTLKSFPPANINVSRFIPVRPDIPAQQEVRKWNLKVYG
jgi:hypothetical protein